MLLSCQYLVWDLGASKQAVNQSVSQSINQSVNQSINQSINQINLIKAGQSNQLNNAIR